MEKTRYNNNTYLWTPEEDTTLIALANEGRSNTSIAAALNGRTAKAVSGRKTWLRSMGIALPRPELDTSGWIPVECAENGMWWPSYNSLAKHLGCRCTAVRRAVEQGRMLYGKRYRKSKHMTRPTIQERLLAV